MLGASSDWTLHLLLADRCARRVRHDYILMLLRRRGACITSVLGAGGGDWILHLLLDHHGAHRV